jgi:hypothetical protein
LDQNLQRSRRSEKKIKAIIQLQIKKPSNVIEGFFMNSLFKMIKLFSTP